MKIAIIGAAGRAGSRIAQEAKSRGHQVTAMVRDASRLAGTEGIKVRESDVFQTGAELGQFDVIVNSFSAKPGAEHQHVEVIKHLITQFFTTLAARAACL
ncbi:NAD(P)H-binding protein [Paenibacillus sp. LHD-38]|uniref:NAD(P)H-binding protein n=1 Tax=Paenibacillus sp. LHD-38 TaxID=3072143 RepID=UPI0035BE9BDF